MTRNQDVLLLLPPVGASELFEYGQPGFGLLYNFFHMLVEEKVRVKGYPLGYWGSLPEE